MPLIVDTWNVLHVTGVLPPELAGIDLPGLVDLVQQGRYRKERITLVCDGPPPIDAPHDHGLISPGLTIRYSGNDRKADEIIQQMIRTSTVPRRLTIVTSDHAILRDARRRRCQVLRSEDFLAHLARDAGRHGSLPREPRSPASLSESQVEQWRNVFNVAEEDAQAIAHEIENQFSQICPEASLKSGGTSSSRKNHRQKPSISESQPDERPASGLPLPPSIVAEAEDMLRKLDETRPERTSDGKDVQQRDKKKGTDAERADSNCCDGDDAPPESGPQ